MSYALIIETPQPVRRPAVRVGPMIAHTRRKRPRRAGYADSNDRRRNYSVPIAIMLTSVHRSAWRAARRCAPACLLHATFPPRLAAGRRRLGRPCDRSRPAAASAATAPALTPQQAQQALNVLENPRDRAQVETTLRAIAAIAR